jgi:hypothetical protein
MIKIGARVLGILGFRRSCAGGTARPNEPITHLYRYRSARAVLEEFEELEKQEIYFSTTDELNDPMEGFKDLFWSGDEIVWRSFLKHYVFCLIHTTYHAFMMGPEFDRRHVERVALAAPDSLPDAPIREIYKRLSTAFLADEAVKTFLTAVSCRNEPVRRNELMGYMRVLHPLALTPIFQDFHSRGLWPDMTPMPEGQMEKLRQNAIKLIQAMTKLPGKKNFRKKFSDAVFAAGEATYAQLQLIAEYNLPDSGKKSPLMFLGSNFPGAYLAALDKLVHRDWYVACFTTRPANHSMWSTYGDGHRGVCLVFKATPNAAGEPCLLINRVVGASGSRNGETTYSSRFVSHDARPVRYSTSYPAIDFFRSLGTIRQMDMNNFWYRDDNGKFSTCREAVYSDEDTWRTQYWETFGQSALYKTPEWAHEEEYRIVVHSFFDMSTKNQRKLKYRFEDLAGIVFGARTDTDVKLKIMRIVDKKCAETGRSNFEFYDVRYTPETSFRVDKLSLLKYEHPANSGDKADKGVGPARAE